MRGRAHDIPKYKKSGYIVNVSEAYKDRLPYTITFLNPLPALFRQDYIYHLLIIDRALPYSIFPEEYHKEIDRLNAQVTDLLNRNSISLIQIHKELLKEMNPNKQIDLIAEERADIVIKKPLREKLNLKLKLAEKLKDRNTVDDVKNDSVNRLAEFSNDLFNDNFREIPLN